MDGFASRARIVAGPAAPPRRREAGSAIVYVMLMVSVLSGIAASLLFTNVARYHTAFQSASWQESIVAAEAGVDLAMNELRKRVVAGSPASFQTSWTTINPSTGKTYPAYGHAFPGGDQPYDLPAQDKAEGNTTTQVRVYVDVPGSDAPPSNFAVANDNSFISQLDNPKLRDTDGVDRSRWLYRIRSLGIAGVSGPARPNFDKRDNALRRVSFFNDWRTGRSLTAPQAARLVEAVARPLTNFRNALMADTKIDLSNQDVLIDSYDSSKGLYNATTNHGQMGNLATNGQLINANHAVVQGNAMTNNGNVQHGENVSGQQSSTFYQELTPFTAGLLNSAWSAVTDDGTVTTTPAKPYVASATSTSPTLVRLDGVNLSNGNTLSVNAPANSSSTTPSYIKIYVQGDIATSGLGQIVLAPNVNAIFYVTGNISLQGSGIVNATQLARNLVINGLQPPANADGTYPPRSINIATTQDFEGIIYAPSHDLNLALQAAKGGSGGSGTDPGTVVVTLTGNNPLIPSYQAILTQAANNGYQIQLDQQAQQTLYNNTHDPAALARVQQDQVLYNQQLAIWNTNKGAVEALGGTVSTSMNTVSDSSAADHAQGYNGIYGGFVARSITVAQKTHVHYDETLRNAGPVNSYQIVNWFEDNASRDATSGPSSFWW